MFVAHDSFKIHLFSVFETNGTVLTVLRRLVGVTLLVSPAPGLALGPTARNSEFKSSKLNMELRVNDP